MMITWDDQRAFLAVLEEGSLSGAARSLGVAQPTVRARIAALEAATRAKLFTRTQGGLLPTDVALALASSARTMAAASEDFVRTASGAADEVSGTVRLSVSEFIGVEVVPAMLADLRSAHPGIEIELSLTNKSADVIGREADVAVRMHRPTQDALVAQKLGSIRLGLFASSGYLRRKGVPLALSELIAHDFIGPDRERRDHELAAAVLPDLGRSHFVVRTDSHPAQLGMARAGLGIAVLQCGVACPDPALTRVLPELVVAEMPTWLVMHEDLRAVPRVRVVFDSLVASFRQYIGTQDDLPNADLAS